MPIARKIKDYAQRLKASPEDASEILAEMRSSYNSLCSYQTALNRLRSYFISEQERHPSYAACVQELETDLVNAYTASITPNNPLGNSSLMTCVKFLYDFKTVPLQRQLKLLQKVRRGEYHLPDKSFVEKLKKFQLLPEYVSKIHLSPEEQIILKTGSSQHMFELSTNVTVIDDASQLLKQMVSILKAKEKTPEQQAVALALLTGRRMTEVLKTGGVQAIPGYPYAAYFSGQLKNGLKNIVSVVDDEPDIYVIPLLCKFHLINSNLQELQRYVLTVVGDSATNEMVNQKFCGRLSKATKSMVLPQLRFHDLRTIYALLAYESFKPHRAGVNGFVAKSLGHTSVSVSSSYTRMQVNNCPARIGTLPPEFYDFN